MGSESHGINDELLAKIKNTRCLCYCSILKFVPKEFQSHMILPVGRDSIYYALTFVIVSLDLPLK